MNLMSIKTWKEIHWPTAEKSILRLQQRIYKASLNKKTRKLHRLQRRLITSEEARAISIKRVTEQNRGRKTPGVDRKIIIKNSDKIKLLKNLRLDGKAQPIRRTYVPKPGKVEKRPLGIPSIEDRAKQMIVKLALEPEWEAKFEPNSYGFRPGRSCHDTIQAIFLSLRGKRRFILDADINKCFDEIDHEKLLNKIQTTSQIQKQIKAWLKADILTGYQGQSLEPEKPESGTPQGGIISPLLMNIALHGMETDIKRYYVNKIYKGTSTKPKRDRLKEIGVYRYADDFIITGEKLEDIKQIQQFTDEWLKSECNLSLSKQKTKITNSTEGFEFLGFQLITIFSKGKYVTKIHISKTSKKRFLTKTRETIQKNKAASTAQLIKILNPIIVGWCNYFRYCQCVHDFKQVEFSLFGQIRAWVFRRQSKNMNEHDIKLKYFPPNTNVTFNGTKHTGNWILTGEDSDRNNKEKKVFLVYPSWIKSENFIKVKGNSSPFNGNHIYWGLRSTRYGTFNATERKILKRQKGKCNLCNQLFNQGDTIEKDHIIRIKDNGKNVITNLQMLHRHCHDIKTRKENLNKTSKICRELNEVKVSRSDLKSDIEPKGSI
jgi:RNA-directed DNA polymerase